MIVAMLRPQGPGIEAEGTPPATAARTQVRLLECPWIADQVLTFRAGPADRQGYASSCILLQGRLPWHSG
jgi:hypothetical protein